MWLKLSWYQFEIYYSIEIYVIPCGTTKKILVEYTQKEKRNQNVSAQKNWLNTNESNEERQRQKVVRQTEN